MAKHVEFPELTPRAEAVLNAARTAPSLRRLAVAVIREAKRQAARGDGPAWSKLDLIADNLHSPPPPPKL